MKITLETIIAEECRGMRLDMALAKSFPDYSRAQLTQWLKSGNVLVEKKQLAPKFKVKSGEHVLIEATLNELSDQAEDLPLDIVYEDEHILVINKPKQCVVHPGAGNREGTLLNALLFHDPSLKHLPRAGIIHRLDKDTTGLMVVTKSQLANLKLIEDLKERKIARHYYALVKGKLLRSGTLTFPIGRHPKNRLKMGVVANGKPATTHYKVLKRLNGYDLLDIKLETGRTHQIRVHFSHVNHPLIGDPLYKANGILVPNLNHELREKIQAFPRPALHAYRLELMHPATQEIMAWNQPLPEDIKIMIKELSNECNHSELAGPHLG